MLRAAKIDLADTADALEHLLKLVPKMTREEKVDVAARVRAVHKHAEAIDSLIKGEIKEWRKGKPGTVKGEQWQAILSVVATTRLDGAWLKLERPDIHTAYSKTTDVERITFAPR